MEFLKAFPVLIFYLQATKSNQRQLSQTTHLEKQKHWQAFYKITVRGVITYHFDITFL